MEQEQSSIMASFNPMQTTEAFLLVWWTKVDSCFIHKFCNYGHWFQTETASRGKETFAKFVESILFNEFYVYM